MGYPFYKDLIINIQLWKNDNSMEYKLDIQD